jgi:hypothetical protein
MKAPCDAYFPLSIILVYKITKKSESTCSININKD